MINRGWGAFIAIAGSVANNRLLRLGAHTEEPIEERHFSGNAGFK